MSISAIYIKYKNNKTMYFKPCTFLFHQQVTFIFTILPFYLVTFFFILVSKALLIRVLQRYLYISTRDRETRAAAVTKESINLREDCYIIIHESSVVCLQLSQDKKSVKHFKHSKTNTVTEKNLL